VNKNKDSLVLTVLFILYMIQVIIRLYLISI